MDACPYAKEPKHFIVCPHKTGESSLYEKKEDKHTHTLYAAGTHGHIYINV